MRFLVPAFLVLTCFNAFALTGGDLFLAKEAALTEAAVEIDLDEIEALETVLDGDEVLVSFLAHDGLLEYGCHYHGSEMACHEEGHDHKELPFSELQRANRAAVDKLEKTLRRRGSDLNSLISMKVWKLEEDHHHGVGDDHEHGSDVWNKFIYDLNGELKTTYVQCHQHAEEGDYACHYKAAGVDEPDMDHGHDH